MSKLLWWRRRSSLKSGITEQAQLDTTASKLPVWALFFWMAQLRRWLRYLWREFVALNMYLTTRAVYKVETRGMENFKYDPSVIVACSHKRDGDIPLVIPRLYYFKRPNHRKHLRMIYVATRDDLYENGFLTLYFPTLDRRFRSIISRVRVARLFKQVQTCPVKLPDEQTVHQLLQETKRLEGNLFLHEVLTPEWYERLLGAENVERTDLRLWDAILKAPLSVLGQYATPRIFKEPLATRIMKRHHQTIVGQLRNISRILDKGGVIFIAPEGRVTPDGRFGKMRAALTRVVQQTRADVKMMPVNVTYDFMDTERPLVIINMGHEVDLKSYAKHELPEIVERSVAGLACVTMSGLGGRWLIEAAGKGQAEISYRDLMHDLWLEAQRLRALGLPLDHRLERRQDFEERFARFIAYSLKKGQIFRNPATALPDLKPDSKLELDLLSLLRAECRKHDDHPARYSYNELLSLLQAHNLLEQAPEETVVFDLAQERKRRRLTAG